MRVLVVTHNFPRFAGDPAGAFVARLAEGIHVRGHAVQVLAPHAPGLPIRETRNGLDVVRFRYAPDALEQVAYRGDMHGSRSLAPFALAGLLTFLAAFRRAVRHAVAAFSPDVIHAHWWIPGGWLAVGTGVPTVITCHGSDVRLLARARVLRALAARVLPRAAAITTVSAFLARDLEAALPSLAGRVQTVAMPLDVDAFSAARDTPRVEPPRILYAGNLLESKGIDDLVRAFALLRQRGVACGLRIVGEGPHRAAVHTLANELGLSDVIEWSDFLPQDAMPLEYGRSTVVVLPTRGNEEGLGLTLVEALLAGAAVVGTRAGGIPEIVRDGETGLLARAGDPADLADKLTELLGSAVLRSRLVQQGRRHVLQRFAPGSSVDHFLALLSAADRHHAAA
jgi:glycosyltransferase involved in cell wall biosynthesis